MKFLSRLYYQVEVIGFGHGFLLATWLTGGQSKRTTSLTRYWLESDDFQVARTLCHNQMRFQAYINVSTASWRVLPLHSVRLCQNTTFSQCLSFVLWIL